MVKEKRSRACFSENICFGHKHRVKGKWPSQCYALKTETRKRGTGNKRRKIIKYKEIQRRETFHTREISSRWAAKANVQQPHYLIHALRKFKFHVLTSTSQLTSSKKLRTSSDDGWRQTGATTLSLTESFRQILVMCMSHTHTRTQVHTQNPTQPLM